MHQYGYANSSLAPTPVMPNAENARNSPSSLLGRRKLNPLAKSPKVIGSLRAQSTVMSVTRLTSTVVTRSSRLYPPERSRAMAASAVIAAQNGSPPQGPEFAGGPASP